MPTDQELNQQESVNEAESAEAQGRCKDQKEQQITKGNPWIKTYNARVRKVFVGVKSGRIRLTLRRISDNESISTVFLEAGYQGGADGTGGGGATEWGPVNVEIEALEDALVYSHVEWWC